MGRKPFDSATARSFHSSRARDGWFAMRDEFASKSFLVTERFLAVTGVVMLVAVAFI
jgi:hypothetical protein